MQLQDFEKLMHQMFQWQYSASLIFRSYCDQIGFAPGTIKSIEEIPYLPVSFFKTHHLQCGQWEPEGYFKSSGTTGLQTSSHAIYSKNWYAEVVHKTFLEAYGHPGQYVWLALLPGYLTRPDSSLVEMVRTFIMEGGHPESGYYLDDHEGLYKAIQVAVSNGKPVILIGVTHALLRFADRYRGRWDGVVTIMETGGMKGHGPELVREEVHERLRHAFGVEAIQSEYGMTELFSQAYARENGLFHPGPMMRVTIRELHDPFAFPGYGRSGRICIADLANFATQAFIMTDDLGKVYPNGSFEVLGRIDGSDIRGCNLMAL